MKDTCRNCAGRIDCLEYELIGARTVARRLWEALKARTGWEAEAVFSHPDVIRMVDRAFDAAEIVSERHHILVEPCRRVLDNQGEMYVAHFPGGESRNVSRDQLLMMGGMDPER